MAYLVRPATAAEDALIAANYRCMWAEYELDKILSDDWLDGTLRLTKQARAGLEYQAFIAEIAGEAVGSAACQVFAGLYPFVFRADKRKYGYIWGVYVAPAARGQGVAKALTHACTDYLRTIGCTRALLHASPQGEPVYESLGLETSNEMRLELKFILCSIFTKHARLSS